MNDSGNINVGIYPSTNGIIKIIIEGNNKFFVKNIYGIPQFLFMKYTFKSDNKMPNIEILTI